MPPTLLATLTQTPGPVLEAIGRFWGSRRILLLAEKPLTYSARATFEEVSAFTIRVGRPRPELLELEGHLASRTLRILEAIRGEGEVLAVLDYSPPGLLVPALLALLSYTIMGGSGEIIVGGSRVSAKTIIAVLEGLPSPKKRVAMRLLELGGATIAELAQSLSLGQRTVQKHLSWLKSHGLVDSSRRMVSPTPWLDLYVLIDSSTRSRRPRSL